MNLDEIYARTQQGLMTFDEFVEAVRALYIHSGAPQPVGPTPWTPPPGVWWEDKCPEDGQRVEVWWIDGTHKIVESASRKGFVYGDPCWWRPVAEALRPNEQKPWTEKESAKLVALQKESAQEKSVQPADERQALKLALSVLEMWLDSKGGRDWLHPGTAYETAMYHTKEAIDAARAATDSSKEYL